MMANYNATQETVSGSLDALEPNMSGNTSSEVSTDRHLERVTPEFAEQIRMQAKVLDGWLQFRVNAYILENIFNHEVIDPSININDVMNGIIIPELILAEERYQNSASTLKQQIAYSNDQLPIRRARLEIREAALKSVGTDLTLKYAPKSEVDKAREDAKEKVTLTKNGIENLTSDITRFRLRVPIEEGMHAYTNGMLKDQEALYKKADDIILLAKPLAYQQALQYLDDSVQALDLDSPRLYQDFNILVAKITTLKAEMQALADIENWNVKNIDTVPEPETPKVRPSLQRAMSVAAGLPLLLKASRAKTV